MIQAPLRLRVPLRSHAGNEWHVLERGFVLELADDTLVDDEIGVAFQLEVAGRVVDVEGTIPCAAFLEGVATLSPVTIDPVSGEPGIVDQDGRVDGRVVYEED